MGQAILLAISYLRSLLFLFPFLFVLQPFLLLAGDHLCEAVINGVGLWVFSGGDLRMVIDDHNTYSDGTEENQDIYIQFSG